MGIAIKKLRGIDVAVAEKLAAEGLTNLRPQPHRCGGGRLDCTGKRTGACYRILKSFYLRVDVNHASQ